MKIERIDDKTVKCFISNEELAEFELSYKDFLFRSEKAKEIVEEIIMQAKEEVGYQPPKYAFDLSVMMMPDQGMILTFSEKETNLADVLSDERMEALLGAFAKAAGEIAAVESKPEDDEAMDRNTGDSNARTRENGSDAEKTMNKQPTFAVFAFRNIWDICQYAAALPSNLRIKSILYEKNGTYYLYLDKGTASYERYSRACIHAMEFGTLYTAENNRVEYLKEHADCLIADHAVKKLRMDNTGKDK